MISNKKVLTQVRVRHGRFICFMHRFVIALHFFVFVSLQVLRKYKVTKTLTISIWETVLRHFCFWHFYLLLVRHDRFICFIERFVIALHFSVEVLRAYKVIKTLTISMWETVLRHFWHLFSALFLF